ncbi:sigma-70 region 4 domain-containing protein [Pseudofrankia sp. BMG5.37]|uniref:sigma-70 region 4 domain-containing protein n=1 Tax=Pseudofrankia sp. BMG5.37 TaxID=3050035 RepID=UPI0028955E69|nr:sigma-70 region 4 domain-containing protein [Pseudofrankia sp. BMG5.37]MDT3439775.1 sigma-70 region 4 domain-containing protein [Pseudofrankia sp. BMG5.37]
MRAAVGQLSETDRAVLTLSAWDGLTTDEIAGALQLTPSAVRQRLHRARRRLREALADHQQTSDHMGSR